MDHFTDALRGRVRDARAAIGRAQAEGDEHALVVRLGELESLRRLADEHEVAWSDVADEPSDAQSLSA